MCERAGQRSGVADRCGGQVCTAPFGTSLFNPPPPYLPFFPFYLTDLPYLPLLQVNSSFFTCPYFHFPLTPPLFTLPASPSPLLPERPPSTPTSPSPTPHSPLPRYPNLFTLLPLLPFLQLILPGRLLSTFLHLSAPSPAQIFISTAFTSSLLTWSSLSPGQLSPFPPLPLSTWPGDAPIYSAVPRHVGESRLGFIVVV